MQSNMVFLYGIKNCDTVKKAKRWLDSHNVNYHFHDFRVDGLQQQLLDDWLQRVEYTQLLNRRSRTWQQLAADERNNMQQEKALQLMRQYPTLIKRPVLDEGKVLLVGFSEKDYNSLFY